MFEPKRIRGEMSTNTMDPRLDGLHGDTKCQVCGNKQMFAAAYPTKSGKGCDIDESLRDFIRDYGAPETMICDGAKSQTSRGSEFVARLRKNRIVPVVSNSKHPNMNPCEGVIRELRKRWYRAIFQTNCPKVLWNYGIRHLPNLCN